MLNTVAVVGRLTADPDLKSLGDTTLANFRIAVKRDRKDKSGDYPTDFFSVTAFGHTAEFVGNYVGKGRLVSVAGRLQYREWNAQDGGKRSAVEIVAESVNALDRRDEAEEATPPPTTRQPLQNERVQDDDEDPFGDA
jgi:single-strand DNA-binding protein